MYMYSCSGGQESGGRDEMGLSINSDVGLGNSTKQLYHHMGSACGAEAAHIRILSPYSPEGGGIMVEYPVYSGVSVRPDSIT